MRRAVVAFALVFSPPGPLVGQADSVHRESLFRGRDAVIASAFVLGTVALAPFDRALAVRTQDSVLQRNRFLQQVATVVRELGFPGSLLIGTSLYTAGRLSDERRLTELGLLGTEAILVGGAFTQAIKWAAGRARPYQDPDNPFDFRFLRGLQGGAYQSFPSGHAVASFAAGSSVTTITGEWWPETKPYIGLVLYGGAALVGLSRMYNNVHWASDVILGAGIGIFAGWKTVRLARAHADRGLQRWLLGATWVPGTGAVHLWLAPVPP